MKKVTFRKTREHNGQVIETIEIVEIDSSNAINDVKFSLCDLAQRAAISLGIKISVLIELDFIVIAYLGTEITTIQYDKFTVTEIN